MDRPAKFSITDILAGIFFLVVYFVLGKIGLQYAGLHPSASAIWPPTGFAIAILLLFGSRYWPFIALGAFLVNVTTTGGVISSLFIAFGNTLEAVVASSLVRRFAGGIHAFDLPMNIVLYILWAGLVSTMLSATIGVTTLAVSGLVTKDLVLDVWLTWWLGDMASAVIITPLIVLWYLRPKITLHRTKTPEFLLLLLFLWSVTFIVFTSRFPFPYLFILPILWSAFRFDLRETATVILFMAVITIRATVRGYGPFIAATDDLNQSLIQLQLFLIIITLTKLMVGSVVADRKRAESALTLREHFFKALIEKNTDAVCLIDPAAVITYASPSTYAVLGYHPEDVIGKSALSYIHPDELERAKENLYKVVARPNDTLFITYRMRHKNGTWRWIETIGRSMLKDEAVRAIVINFRDISERKLLEEAKNEFFMIAAHQLRSPLTSIRWHLESVLSPTANVADNLRNKLSRVYESNQTMIRTVNEILDVTRIIEGKLTSHPEKVDVGSLIKTHVDMYKGLADGQQDMFVLRLPDVPLPEAIVDPKHLALVIDNILSNAVKYTKKGTITITADRTRETIIVTTADTGVGIPVDEQKDLFTKFYRTTNARIIDAQGAGLGLFIVKSFVESWGGNVTLISPTMGSRGTTVRFTIPVTES